LAHALPKVYRVKESRNKVNMMKITNPSPKLQRDQEVNNLQQELRPNPIDSGASQRQYQLDQNQRKLDQLKNDRQLDRLQTELQLNQNQREQNQPRQQEQSRELRQQQMNLLQDQQRKLQIQPDFGKPR
jgi:hypothetical protein